MAVDRFLLMERLMALEAAAAACGELLGDADEELLQLVADAFAPTMPKGHRRSTWNGYWFRWLKRCATTAVSPEASLDLDVSSAAIENTPSRSCDESGSLIRPNASEYGPLISPVAVNCPAHSADHTGTQGSAEAAENAAWAWVMGSVQCSSGSGVD